ncbi:MAG: CrcB family protein [Rothia sp. (in: high G+C Gram-positive bacteria)]|uniref:fluoride efflux transporter FluC n=1 Tax=Rothia sp. (in: high G+C Gram-positive bacteria) TaxID=1885016 RepID=UPI002702AAEA|nr:CrcB family protein [Rothia sp. (in: high G+C Gram-positive bacteria)]
MTPTFRTTWLVFVGGGAGALVRALLIAAFPVSGLSLPVTVLLVNWAGAFLLAFLTGYLLAAAPGGVLSAGSEQLRLLVGTGFLGGFTTYSTFALALAQLTLSGHWWTAAGYALLSLVGGYLLAWAGWRLGAWWGMSGRPPRAGTPARGAER